MIIDNFYVGRPWRAVWPFKTDPPLVIDADAVLPITISGQCFKTIAGQDGKILQHGRCFQAVEFQARRALDSRERFHPFPSREVSGALVSVADDQSTRILFTYALRQA